MEQMQALRTARWTLGWTVLDFLVLGLVQMTVLAGHSKQVKNEKTLFRDLFKDYEPMHRPVTNSNAPVLVDFGLYYNQLLDLDEKKQVMTSSVWIQEGWKDEGLQWTPKDYDDQDVIMVSPTHLWVPDIFIFNTGGGELEGFVNVTGSKLMVNNTGYVTWIIPLLVRSACAVDVTYFPYDHQHCEIRFGSWIYDISKLDLRCHPDTPNFQEYVLNNEFDVQDFGLYRTVVNQSCCPTEGLHPNINFYIHLKRKSIYYDYIVIAPTLNLCFLTLATFLLPCHHGDKIAIGLTVFLTLYVLQLLIAENVPDTITTPILGIFIFLVMTLNCISLILATLVMSIKKKANLKPIPEVPELVLHVCEKYLSRFTCTNIKSRVYEYDACGQEDERYACAGKSEEQEAAESKTERCECHFELYESEDSESDIDESQSMYGDDFNMQEYYNLEIISSSDTLQRDQNSKSALLDFDHTQERNLSDKHNKSYRDRICVRKRRSYKRAIHQNPICHKNKTSDTLQSLDSLQDEDMVRKGIVNSNTRKKQEWCFVAETVDKSSFLVYTLSMFVTIFTVLVLVPSLQ